MKWKPGDPLYLHPQNTAFGQEVRPMFELIDDHDDCRCDDGHHWIPKSAVAASWSPPERGDGP